MDEIKDWRDCGIWKELQSRDGDHVEECIASLTLVMPDVQRILASGNTSPNDFTLHDAGHSFRVAQRSLEIVADSIQVLSVFDLTLLLLASYLHDIGMTPTLKKVDGHYNYLLTADDEILTQQEVEELQKWLDDNGYPFVPPIPESMPLLDRLGLAREITTHYCRSRHNDWSAEWIRDNLTGNTLSNYSEWIGDLILLCQSHHFGHENLIRDVFRPRRVANPSAIVNLRFLALVLRAADILDFDPERTPDVILRHRDISSESAIYWWKDPQISFTLTDRRVGITSRPSSARIQKAIEETADDVDAELALCRKIADDIPLAAIPGETDVPYRWELAATCHRDIVPREGTYEYINGAFRPDTGKLLSLLSGTALYRTSFDAVRELIQNAFDAVGESIARKRLDSLNPKSPDIAIEIARHHRVSLQFEIDGDHAYLTCTDNGIGMTKAIIRDRVLVSGSSVRHDVRALERLCREKGFVLGRSGKFGIGILSYFMIATNVEIETLRAQEAGDSDHTRWHFETEGVGSFGELKKVPGNKVGTKVHLRLNEDIFKRPTVWYEELRAYLGSTLVHCPCEFTLWTSLPGCQALEFKPGWSTIDNSAFVIEQLEDRKLSSNSDTPKLISTVAKEKKLAAHLALTSLQEKVKSCLRWLKEEGTLSDGSGHYEIQVPYFDLMGGVCLAFLNRSEINDGGDTLLSFLGGTHFLPRGVVGEAWKGMAVIRSDLQRVHSRSVKWSGLGFLRVNWISDGAGQIMASRDTLLGAVPKREGRDVEVHHAQIIRTFLEDNRSSSFAWLNERIAEVSIPNPAKCSWLHISEKTGAAHRKVYGWEEILFPAMSRSAFGYTFSKGGDRIKFHGKPINIVPWSVPAPNRYGVELNALGWNSPHHAPDRVVILDSWQPSLAPVWTKVPLNATGRNFLKSRFPPAWKRLCGARFSWYAGYANEAIVWNSMNPIVKQVTVAAWEWSERAFLRSMNPLPCGNELRADASKAASWILQCIASDSSELWEGLAEHDPEFLQGLLDLLHVGKAWPLLLWVEEPGQNENRLRVLTANSWHVAKESLVEDYLPAPPDAWRIGQKGIGPRYWQKRRTKDITNAR